MLLASTSSLAKTTTRSEGTSPWAPELLQWYSCGERLAAGYPLSESQVKAALHTVADASVDTTPEFLSLTTAIIAAESAFNNNAVSAGGAVGYMQLTLIGAKEAGKACPFLHSGGVSDLALALKIRHPAENVKHGTCLLKYYLSQVDNNLLHALVLYNGGYVQLTRLVNTGTLTEETSKYVLRVHSYLGRCSK